MQQGSKKADGSSESVLAEMNVIIQAVNAEADMEQHALETGNIILSMPEEVSIEAMKCTGSIIKDKKPVCVAICMYDFVAEAPELFMRDLKETDLTYGFFAAHYADTVISECAIYFPHTALEEYLPIRILSAKMLFEDGRELDYSDKISACAIESLAKAAG